MYILNVQITHRSDEVDVDSAIAVRDPIAQQVLGCQAVGMTLHAYSESALLMVAGELYMDSTIEAESVCQQALNCQAGDMATENMCSQCRSSVHVVLMAADGRRHKPRGHSG